MLINPEYDKEYRDDYRRMMARGKWLDGVLYRKQRESAWGLVLCVFACLLIILAMMVLPSCARAEEIKASWYSDASLKKEGTFKTSNGIMANGKAFDENALTCAARMYPLGATIEVTNLKNGKSVIVKVTDRIGKRFATSRIDLSKAAFMQIADLKTGVVSIKTRRVL